MKNVKPFPGKGHRCGSVVHLEREAGSDTLRVLSITIDNTVLNPSSAASEWRVAKLYAGMHARYMSLYCHHPHNHFVVDVVIAATKSCLPAGHVLRKLLEPHLAFQSNLDDTVLNDPAVSPLCGTSWLMELYNANMAGPDEIRKLVSAEHTVGDTDEEAGDKAHRWDREPPILRRKLRLCKVYREKYFILRDLVSKVLGGVEFKDVAVINWANAVKEDMPEFPSGDQLFSEMDKNEKLILVVTNLIFTVSVAHSLDHISMFNQPASFGRMVLRVPPPSPPSPDASASASTTTATTPDELDSNPDYAPTFTDVVRQAMYDHMFVTWVELPSLLPGDSGSLATVQYSFSGDDTGGREVE